MLLNTSLYKCLKKVVNNLPEARNTFIFPARRYFHFACYLTKLHKVCVAQEACMLSGWESLCWGFEYGCIVFMCLFGAWHLIYCPKTNYFVLSFFVSSIKYIKPQSCRGRKQFIYYNRINTVSLLWSLFDQR